MKRVIFIQARLSSSRFPFKMLKLLGSVPLVEYVYNRCKCSRLADKVVVLTSTDKSDDRLAVYCAQKGIPFFRGPLLDVRQRYIEGACKYQSSTICRVCGDSPFVDVSLIDTLFGEMRSAELDYVTVKNVLNGFFSEVFTLRALEVSKKISGASEDMEHVTPFIRNCDDVFNTKVVDAVLRPQKYEHFTLTIDYEEDLHLANRLLEGLYGYDFTSNDVIEILKNVVL